MRVLFAEDDEAVGRATTASLTAAGFVVDLVESREDAVHALKTNRYDAAIFDILLTDGSGLDALAEVRRSGLDLPVLLLTALGSVDDRVTGLNAIGSRARVGDQYGKPSKDRPFRVGKSLTPGIHEGLDDGANASRASGRPLGDYIELGASTSLPRDPLPIRMVRHRGFGLARHVHPFPSVEMGSSEATSLRLPDSQSRMVCIR